MIRLRKKKERKLNVKFKKILSISPYSVRMRENTDQKNSEYGHFSRSDKPYFYKVIYILRFNIGYKVDPVSLNFRGKSYNSVI